MVQPLLTYPDPRIKLISGNVRHFNDTLQSIIEDMMDTMQANGLAALSAIQIGIQYNVIVLEEDGVYVPYINARFLKQRGRSAGVERSTYYDFTAEVVRYTALSVVYEDAQARMHSRDVEGELARIFQSQLDYADGSTFVDRVPSAVKKQIDAYLEQGLVKDSRTQGVENSGCPTVFVRDRIKHVYQLLLGAVLLCMAMPLFISGTAQAILYGVDLAVLGSVVLLCIVYFFTAQYESKKYKQCTSCQTGNILGTVAIALAQTLLLAVGVFLWIRP